MSGRGRADAKETSLRDRLIGLGERSIKKSYYPELKRRRSELERFRALLDSAGDGILLADADTHKVVDANKTLCEMLGKADGDIVGSEVCSLFDADGEGPCSRHFSSRREQTPCTIETVITFPGARDMHVELKLSEKHFSDRRFTVVLVRDVTQRKLMEEALRRSKQAADAANRAKSEFLANMSHEIRTPLNGVMGMLQLLQASSLPPELEDLVFKALTSSKRLTRLLSDILDLSRIEADKLSLEEAPFAVDDQCAELETTFGRSAEEKGLYLNVSLHEGMPEILVGDETRLRQILFNLVGNAIKFTDKGGVSVHIQALTPPAQTPLRVLFTVADTGIGIPDERLRDIFEPFSQVENDYTRRFQGAGLGLSIARKLVRMLGGEMAVADTEGGGTTIYLSLPFGLSESSPAPDAPEPTNPPEPATVLLADDDDTSLLATRRMLEKMGHTVVVARNGQEVLARLEESAVDLILMDIQMPIMDGVAATRTIRDSGKPYSDTPIIALTAYTMAEEEAAFLAAGMDGLLAKPVEMQRLHETIRKIQA